MLQWYREQYAATATDAAAATAVHLITPDGVLHDPATTRTLSKREDWVIHYLQVYVLATTTGYLKHGVVGQLVLGLDTVGSWLPLVAPNHGLVHPNFGLIYRGGPFKSTHGVGWAFYKGALADTDKVVTRLLYEPVARGPM